MNSEKKLNLLTNGFSASMKGYGTIEVYPENYIMGAKALFGLGKISINMLVERATGKILGQAITGEGAAEFIKYEARVTSGKVVFSETSGNVIRLKKGTNAWGFDHIFKSRAEGGISRALQIYSSSNAQNFFQNTFGKKLESFGDLEKLIEYILKNGKYVPKNSAGNIEYNIDIGGKFLKVISKPGSNSITTISF